VCLIANLFSNAQFLYVPADKVLETPVLLETCSYDGKDAEFAHQHPSKGEICSFATLCGRSESEGKVEARHGRQDRHHRDALAGGVKETRAT